MMFRVFAAASLFAASAEAFVTLKKDDQHTLYYVSSVFAIADVAPGEKGPISEIVDAYSMTNDKGVKVKAMARGANMVELSDMLSGVNYVWENQEGACYYGAQNVTENYNPNSFPLNRGLILNGGVRFAAVSAEHGLYYDFDWDVSFDESVDNEKSIIFSVVDSQANRDIVSSASYLLGKPYLDYEVPTGFSGGQFNIAGQGDMSRYPVTDMKFEYKITLRGGEDFVRLHMSVTNPSPDVKTGEAWLPMTFPINSDSVLLSGQDLRWRRDLWCYDDILPNMVEWDLHADPFDKPLAWPGNGIFYDFPYKKGTYHGVTTDSGRGVVYYAPEKTPHYTKMWSWGDPALFNRTALLEQLAQPGDQTGAALAVGRPASEYYEPWSSGTNFAFFQTAEFRPSMKYSWEIAVLPIKTGLDSTKTTAELNARVEEVIAENPGLTTLQEVVEESAVKKSGLHLRFVKDN